MAEVGDRGGRTFGKSHSCKRHLRRFAQFGFALGIAPEVKRMSAMRLHRKGDIVERGEVRKQRCHLKGARQPQLAALIDRQVRDFLTVETDAPAIRRNFSGQLTNQSALTSATRT